MSCSEWTFEERGRARTLLLLPGWATDERVFGGVGAGFDRLLPPGFVTGPEVESGCERLDGAAVVVGWSLGGFAAADFAARHADSVEKLVLIGVRRRYPREEIERVRRALTADREACLRRFYRECFLPAQREDFRRFRAELMPVYLDEMGTERLQEGLDYLEWAEIDPAALPAGKTVIVHGADDAVAPVEEARTLAAEAGVELRVVDGAGHAAFLSPGFDEILSDD